MAKITGCGEASLRGADPFGRFGWFTDPEGNRVELWQPPDSLAHLPSCQASIRGLGCMRYLRSEATPLPGISRPAANSLIRNFTRVDRIKSAKSYSRPFACESFSKKACAGLALCVQKRQQRPAQLAWDGSQKSHSSHARTAPFARHPLLSKELFP
jgi:hypothetical protein